MEPDEVLGNEPPNPDVPAKGQGKDDYVPLTRTEAESLRRERDEARESERYWSAHARGNGQQQQAAEPEAEDASEFYAEETASNDEDTPEKLVDDFAATGVKALQKRGFITAADAQKLAADTALRVTREMIGRERQKMGSDTKILADFPELKDQTSDLWKETAKHYKEAVDMDPNAAKTPAALYLAAKTARATLKAQAKIHHAPKDDDEDTPEPESDRRARASSQDGRAKGRAEVEDDDMLGSEARSIIKSMGITEAEFKASRKETAGSAKGRR